ncbi:MAG: hypothetical protein JXR89_08740 [Deltaproteobacteria bacterium]|nr:hypothetical protein [Deltaproteobacteria bacterium]
MLLFRREQREHNQLRQRIAKVNTAVAKLFDGKIIARVAQELGLRGRDGKLKLEKDGDTSALVDLLIFREKLEGRHPVEVFLEKQNDDFFPALQRRLLEAYLKENHFSLFRVKARRERRFLDLEPLLENQEKLVLDEAVLARVADDDWILAGRFIPWEGCWIHPDLIYAFDPSATDKIFGELEKLEPKSGLPYRDRPEKYPHFFFRIYREFGIPLGNR